jgi:coenzyme F420-reducing hydrogenase delta subunit
MEHMGVEKDRLHFSWISSAEANKFIDVVNTVTESVKALGPSKNFVKKTG